MAAPPDRPGRVKVPAARADLVGGEPRSWNQLIGMRRDADPVLAGRRQTSLSWSGSTVSSICTIWSLNRSR
jgi:hypothetical protein